jgi:hypothetical protein
VERDQEVALLRSAVPAVVRRPDLWPTAITQAFRLAPRGWWRRKPFLPLPDDDYLRFRLQTQYGDASHEPLPRDLVTYLEWCRGYRRVAR